MTTTRAAILARGLGTRMRAADPAAPLTPEQRRAADMGIKAMMPVHGHPFLDYILSGLADAGLTDIALIVAPDHDALKQRYELDARPSRVSIAFVVQREARGTADAVLTVESWTRGEDFLVMNGDNLYPTQGLVDLATLDEPGLLAFDRDELLRTGNIPAERLQSFALIDVDANGYLEGIVEKPSVKTTHPLISMNCWRFDARIFQACRDVPLSSRGELELPEAVGLAVRRGMKLRALRAHGGVLDLSRRADAATLENHLKGVTPRP